MMGIHSQRIRFWSVFLAAAIALDAAAQAQSDVDLAAEPFRSFTHAPWILPENDYPPAPGIPLTY